MGGGQSSSFQMRMFTGPAGQDVSLFFLLFRVLFF